MMISRYICFGRINFGSVPKEFWIEEEEFERLIETEINLMLSESKHDSLNKSVKFLNAVHVENNDIIFSLSYGGGRIHLSGVEDLTEKIVVNMDKYAKKMEAFLMKSYHQKYPENKIQYAKRRISTGLFLDKSIRYYSRSFGNRSQWLAIKSSNALRVFQYFNITGQVEKLGWEQGLGQEGMFITKFKGFIFINNPELLYNYSKNFYFEGLNKWIKEVSLIFDDVQFFIYGKKHICENGFFRAIKGNLEYGYYENSEGDKYEYGTEPKNVFELLDNKAYTVASLWSFNPLDLVYFSEIQEANCWICKPLPSLSKA